ncbi:MAG: YraN family protein [Rhodobacteraceae bacterium]|nr:YraN family protein [Paracoccaceae bacterium]
MAAARPAAGAGTGAAGHPQRRLAGRRSEIVGRTAEDAAADHFLRAGARLVARRWRGEGGEIDLVLREGGTHVFVEVKRAGTWAAAAARIGPRQVARVMAAALEFLAGDPRGQDAEMRFDVALVDGTGRVEVMRNALAA